jgi:hypothetical protein
LDVRSRLNPMFGRRILVLVAVLMGLTALAASLAPPPESVRRPGAAAGPSPTPSATSAPEAEPAPAPSVRARTVTARLYADRGIAPGRVTAAQGDTVRLQITGNTIDTVVIDGLAVMEPIDPDSPVQLELFADTPGSYPIRLLDANRRIGALRITASG